MRFCEFEKYQMDRFINQHFVILRGPRLSGKSHFIRDYFEGSKENYVIFDVFKAWMEKDSWVVRSLVEDLKLSIENNAPVGSVVFFNLDGIGDFNDFHSMLSALPQGTHVVFDHAEFLGYARKDNSDPREFFQEFIDLGHLRFVFVPRSTSRLLNYLGVGNYSSPLFGRFEVFVEVVPLSPNESMKFLGDCPLDVVRVYGLTGGLRGALELLRSVDCDVKEYRKMIGKIVLRDLAPKGSKKGRKLVEVAAAVAKETRVREYVKREDIVQKYGIDKKSLSRYLFPLYELGYVDFLNKDIIKTPTPFQFFDI